MDMYWLTLTLLPPRVGWLKSKQSRRDSNNTLTAKIFAMGEWHGCRGLALHVVANSGISSLGL